MALYGNGTNPNPNNDTSAKAMSIMSVVTLLLGANSAINLMPMNFEIT